MNSENLPEKIISDTVWIHASPTRVFKALTDANELIKWFPDQEAVVTPEIGGRIQFKWRSGGVLNSKVQTYIPDQELSYGFYGGENEPVTFNLVSEKSGTRVKLTHRIPAGSNLVMIVDIATHWAHLLVGLKCWVERDWDIRS